MLLIKPKIMKTPPIAAITSGEYPYGWKRGLKIRMKQKAALMRLNPILSIT